MKPVLQNAKMYLAMSANKEHISEPVTTVAKCSPILLEPLRENIKHASELSHPRKLEEA